MRDLWQHFEDKYQDLAIEEVGIQLFEPGESFQYMAYQNFILHYVEKGQGTYHVNDKTYHLKAGDGFIIRKGMAVHYAADEKDPWKNYWIGLNGHYLKQHLAHTTLLQNVVLTFEKDSMSANVLKEICHTTLETLPNRPNDSWYLGKVYQLLTYLNDEFSTTQDDLSGDKEEPQNYAKIAFDYIYNNYMYAISIQEIADYIGINRSYLYRTFKEEYNMSPHQFLVDFRMGVAQRLLLQTDDPIYIVAGKVGYADQLQFSKAFKKRFNISPTPFREKYQMSGYEEFIDQGD